MEADYKHLLRLLKIEAYEIPFTFVNEKPVIDDGYFQVYDSLTSMEEVILKTFPRLVGSLDFGLAKYYCLRFLEGLSASIAEHNKKMEEVENYKKWKKRKKMDREHQ